MIEEEFKFDNYSRHLGFRGRYDWYEWKVFMVEPPEVLEKISTVEYRLHETFPNPIRIVKDRKSGFALSSAGWGNFTIHITVYLKDGREIPKKYYLELKKPWPSSEPTKYDINTIGTSY